MAQVSVVMIVYNSEKFVTNAVESILDQSFQDFEFLILDDCSTDWSYEILKNFAKKDTRIRLFQNEKNKGISFSRNKILSFSTTDFIIIQDSDDISFPDRIEKSYNFLWKNPDYAAVSGDNVIINEQWKKIGYREYSSQIQKNILKKSPISHPAAMFRKKYFEKVGGYDKNLNFGEDYDLWIRFFMNNFKIKKMDEFLIYYRIQNNQTKIKNLKNTLKNTIFIQKKAIKKGFKPSFSDRIYIFLEEILLFLPEKIILKIFIFLTYKNEK